MSLSTERRAEIERLIKAGQDDHLTRVTRNAGMVPWPDVAAELLAEVDRLRTGQVRR